MEVLSVKKVIFKHKFKILVAFILQTLDDLLGIYMAFLFGLLINSGVNKNFEGLKTALVGSIILIILMPIFMYIKTVAMKSAGYHVLFDLRLNIIDGYMSNNIEKFRRTNKGDKIAILTNDTDLFFNDFLLNLFNVWHYVFTLIATIVALFFISTYMAAVLIGLTIISLLLSNLGSKNVEKLNGEKLEAISQHTTKMEEFISGHHVVHDFKLQKFSHKTMLEYYKISFTKMMNYTRCIGLSQSLGMLFGGLVFMGGFIVGSYLVFLSLLPVGMLITCIQLSNNLSQPIFFIISLKSELKGALNTIEKIDQVLSENAQDVEDNKKLELTSFDLDLDNLRYEYEKSGFSLENINDKIPFGKKVCILGHSGSGKSTFIKLLTKEIEPKSGSITIGNINYKDITENQLLDVMGIISQDVFMFNASIKDNITLFDNKYSDEEVIQIMKRVGLDGFIEKRNDNDLVSELGNNLSGGEKQRIAIARCILRNRSIIVADEAFAALDNKLAYSIEDEMLSIDGITFINITHRLFKSNLKKYDEIWVLDKGVKIVGGNYNEIHENDTLESFISVGDDVN